jgi:hypothetical protein
LNGTDQARVHDPRSVNHKDRYDRHGTRRHALHGFGHGVFIAAEPVGGAVHLWTEWRTSVSGFSTRIGRFRYVDGATLAAGDGSIEDRTPSIGDTMINPQPAIDPAFGRLLVRYKVAADMPRIVVST